MRAHDETLADELDNYRINMGRGIPRKSDKIEKVILDIPQNIDHEFSNHLTTRVIERTTDSWGSGTVCFQYFMKQTGIVLSPAVLKMKMVIN